MEQLRVGELLLLLVLIATSTLGQNGDVTTTEEPETSTPECEPSDSCCHCPLSQCSCPSGFSLKPCAGEGKYKCGKEVLPVLPIALSAVGGGLVLIIIITALICACIRCRKQNQNSPENVKPIKCTTRQSVEQGTEVGEQPEDDTYLILLPEEGLPCSTNNDSTPPTTDTIYVNMPKEGNSPRLPAKTPPAQLKFCLKEVPKIPEEVKTDTIYANVPTEMSDGVSPRTSNHPSPPPDEDDDHYHDDDNDDDDGDDAADSDEDAYDYPGAPYNKPMKEAKARATSPKKLDDEHQTASLQRGRAPAAPSRDQDIYSPVYEERNMARGVNFPSSPKLGSPCSPKAATDHIYGNVPFNKSYKSPSTPDIQNMMRLSPAGYLPMAGSEGRLTRFQYARDSAANDELYVNDPQVYVNTSPNSFS